MKKSVAMKWIKALRSGKYKQGKGTLLKDNKYCCLGVLCDIAPKGIRPKEVAVLPHQNDNLHSHPQVQKWADIYTYNGEFKYAGDNLDAQELADLNDSGKTFKQIANLIEKHWRRL